MCEEGRLPVFRYFFDPVAVGTLIPNENKNACPCCNLVRDFVYVGPCCGGPDEVDFEAHLCPWCIADGTAARKFGVEFVDEDGIGDYGHWDQVDVEVAEEVSKRTPCFTAWQQERWWTHCGDAAVFVDYAGKSELMQHGIACVENIRKSVPQPIDDEEWAAVLEALKKDGSMMAYVFQCRHCGELGGYWDCW